MDPDDIMAGAFYANDLDYFKTKYKIGTAQPTPPPPTYVPPEEVAKTFTNEWIAALVLSTVRADFLEPSVIKNVSTHNFSKSECKLCGQVASETYAVGWDRVCPEHWDMLKDYLVEKMHDQALLNRIRYASAKEHLRTAYMEHGKMLLDSMEYIRLWVDDINDTGHKVFFLGRDMDIFYILMKEVYGYTPDKIAYLEGWSRSFCGCSNSQKEATLKRYGVRDGDGVIDTGFSGTVPDDIKRFRDIKATLLTKNYTGYIGWVECFRTDQVETGAPGHIAHYRTWMVKFEHSTHRGVAIQPTHPLSTSSEMWDESDEFMNHKFYGRVLAYKWALKKAEIHEAKEAKARQKNWVYKPAAQITAEKAEADKATCTGCICKNCYNYDLGRNCSHLHNCNGTHPSVCVSKHTSLEGCYFFLDAYNIDPNEASIACKSCMCAVCEKLHTQCQKGVDSCWGCKGAYLTSSIHECTEFVGEYHPHICSTCKCYLCKHKNTSVTWHCPGCSPSPNGTCSTWSENCESFHKQSCDGCQCKDCSKVKNCVGICQASSDNGCSWKHTGFCSVKPSYTSNCNTCLCNNCIKSGGKCSCQKVDNKTENIYYFCETYIETCSGNIPKPAQTEPTVTPGFCTNCSCKICANSIDTKCGVCHETSTCTITINNCAGFEFMHPEDAGPLQPLPQKGCIKCLCANCMTVCPEEDICVGCTDPIEFCQHYSYQDMYAIQYTENPMYEILDQDCPF